MLRSFAAAILGGLQAGVPKRVVNGLGLWVVAMRAVYNELYLQVESQKYSQWRTVGYYSQDLPCTGVLVVAAFQYGD